MGIALGIDLGTTNTVAAKADLDAADAAVVDFELPQLVAPGEVAALPQLASTMYLPATGELDEPLRRLPWGDAPAFPIGAYARAQGARVPGRVIASAKSWLSAAHADRKGRILPWAADDETLPRRSPVEVQTALLDHVARAVAHAGHDVVDEVTVTIPASFDEVARELTLEAAQAAELPAVRLLEEPQAAFYALLQRRQNDLKALLEGVRLVLVADVGGGTSDFTLLSVDAGDGRGPPRIDRVAVGDHLMLGGDNMDVTLARSVEQKLTGAVGALDAVSFAQLVLSARLAKEALLADDAPDEFGVTLLSRGSRLIGGGRTSTERRDAVRALLLDGFFGACGADETVDARGRAGFAELGLPYAREPSIPRHILTFLRRHAAAAAASGAKVRDGLPIPDAVLLNGGVFRAHAIRQRLAAVFASWAGGPVRFLDVDGADLDRAVARGAAYASFVRRGRGVRIGGGSARSYFVGVDTEAGARALCMVPRGLHEGERVKVDRTFRVVLGQPVTFPLFSSTFAAAGVGELVDTSDLERLPSISTVLQPGREVPVHLEALLSEVGTLELSLRMTPEALERFRLAVSTRLDGVVEGAGAAGAGQVPQAGPVHKRIDDGKELIAGFFGHKSKDVDPRRVKDLRRDLEKHFGPREQWSLALSRELGGVLLAGLARRRRSADHERAFFQLLGWCLRPGTGAAFDDWRLEQLWALWKEGVQYVAEKPTWGSWFVLWRRVVGGLDSARQREVWDYLKPWLLEQGTGRKGAGATPHGQDEMVRLACSLERIPSSEKVALGDFVARKLGRGGLPSFWPLGRLGARAPLQGGALDVVGPDVAARWIERVLEHDLKVADGGSFALASLARLTGDRARDIDAGLRDKVVARLERVQAPTSWVQMVREVVPLSADDEAQAFGDSLPVGLRL
ncbi:MAG: hsp70 family protein [Deltaproteobacteria bacterium]|nr:hsp70 family protein [Deltaproteobacteria bacterium]